MTSSSSSLICCVEDLERELQGINNTLVQESNFRDADRQQCNYSPEKGEVGCQCIPEKVKSRLLLLEEKIPKGFERQVLGGEAESLLSLVGEVIRFFEKGGDCLGKQKSLFPLLTVLFKVCRNFCASCAGLVNNNLFGFDRLTMYKSVLENVTSLDGQEKGEREEDEKEILTMGKFCLQFMGNACVNNPSVQDAVWQSLFPHLISSLLLVKESVGTKTAASMIMYICLGGNEGRIGELLEKGLLGTLLRFADDGLWDENGHEWVLFGLKLFIARNGAAAAHRVLLEERKQKEAAMKEGGRGLIQELAFCDVEWKLLSFLDAIVEESSTVNISGLHEYEKRFDVEDEDVLMEVTEFNSDFLPMTESKDSLSNSRVVTIPIDTALLLGRTFIRTLPLVEDPSFWGEEELADFPRGKGETLVHLLSRLVANIVSKGDVHIKTLYRRQGVIDTAVGILKAGEKHQPCKKLPKDAKDFDSVYKQHSVTSSGVKSQVVALVGNICHKDKANQDVIRRIGGIPTILNHCNMDMYSPYLKEWAVLAVRHLCENNMENQNLISQMEAMKVTEQTVLEDQDFEVEIDSTGKLRPKKKQ
eukprot:Nk52_evm63s224 gene=Nk52_evmTU63s224